MYKSFAIAAATLALTVEAGFNKRSCPADYEPQQELDLTRY